MIREQIQYQHPSSWTLLSMRHMLPTSMYTSKPFNGFHALEGLKKFLVNRLMDKPIVIGALALCKL